MVQTTNLLQLAQQGEPQAIATLISQKLQPKGITAKVAIKEQTLKILLESSVVPDQAAMTAFVLKGITSLKIDAFNRLQVFGKSKDQSTPGWTQAYPLNSASPASEIAVDNSTHNATISAVEQPVATTASAPAGSLDAIAELLNRAIADSEITIKATQEDKLLKIIVETNKFLDGQSFASRIHQELKNADVSQFEAVSIYKQKLKGSHSFQIKSFSLVVPREEAPPPEPSQPEDGQRLGTGSQKIFAEGKTAGSQPTGKPKIKIGRLISVAVIGVLAAFFIYRAVRRMLFVIWASPIFGGFSIIMGLFVLWRAWVVLNPLLQALLRDE